MSPMAADVGARYRMLKSGPSWYSGIRRHLDEHGLQNVLWNLINIAWQVQLGHGTMAYGKKEKIKNLHNAGSGAVSGAALCPNMDIRLCPLLECIPIWT